MRLGFGLVLLAIASANVASAIQACDDAASSEKRIHEALGFQPGSLYATRRADLSGSIVDLQYSTRTAGVPKAKQLLPLPIRQVEVFDLARQGRRVANGRIVSMSVDLDDAQLWRVGLDCETGSVYRLYGFHDRIEGVDGLVAALALAVTNSEEAIELQATAYALMTRFGLDSTIRSDLDLLRSGLRSYAGPPDWPAFRTFWSKHSGSVSRANLVPRVDSEKGHKFRVRFVGDDDGRIVDTTMVVNSNGQISIPMENEIFRWKRKR